MKGTLSWFDRLMIGITYAEANVKDPDLDHIDQKDGEHKEQEGHYPFDGETVLVR